MYIFDNLATESGLGPGLEARPLETTSVLSKSKTLVLKSQDWYAVHIISSVKLSSAFKKHVVKALSSHLTETRKECLHNKYLISSVKFRKQLLWATHKSTVLFLYNIPLQNNNK